MLVQTIKYTFLSLFALFVAQFFSVANNLTYTPASLIGDIAVYTSVFFCTIGTRMLELIVRLNMYHYVYVVVKVLYNSLNALFVNFLEIAFKSLNQLYCPLSILLNSWTAFFVPFGFAKSLELDLVWTCVIMCLCLVWYSLPKIQKNKNNQKAKNE